MSKDQIYKGSCFCGAVELEVSGEPLMMGYCHCSDCRHWGASPINAYTLWKPDAVKITKGEEKIISYNKTDKSDRKSCNVCGGHIYTFFNPLGIFDIYAAIIPDLEFKPDRHVFYGESILPIKDGLPKYKDLPSQAGGSGEMIPE